MKHTSFFKKKHIQQLAKSVFWFSVGALFKQAYKDVVYPGVMVNNVNFGGKKQEDVKAYFKSKNNTFADTQFVFITEQEKASISAKELEFGYDEELLAKQTYSIGRSSDPLSNISLILEAYLNGVYLEPSYRYSERKFEEFITPLAISLKVEPLDALFTFENNRVSAFRLSKDGQELDMDKLKREIASQMVAVISEEKPQIIKITLPIKTVKPKITTDKVNSLGIKELLGVGTSLFQGSIPGRIHNISLAATRLNGVLVAPGEEFSFNKALGDVSAFTGYQQAYIIQNGRTVLGDGGGVCQVSTTFFRALLNAGLPITERHAHSYRVGYYEQDSPPGLDATIFVPSVDLRFKNDTGKHILIQSVINPDIQQLTFFLYGTSDGRTVSIGKPVITSQSPAPAPSYQDDPTLPKGQMKQVDFAAPGAQVYFTREVKKNNKVIISEKFVSSYRPWQAVYLRGTKENLRAQEKKIVLAGGCFDIVHQGHMAFLKMARAQGDSLFVLVESDESVKILKGKDRPINPQRNRAQKLASLPYVDIVIPLPRPFSDKDYDGLVNEIKPAIIATTKGDPGRKHKERQAREINAQVIDVSERMPNQSTTLIAKRKIKTL